MRVVGARDPVIIGESPSREKTSKISKVYFSFRLIKVFADLDGVTKGSSEGRKEGEGEGEGGEGEGEGAGRDVLRVERKILIST